ncbi:S-type pyocin domain-containing protein [Pseudomonas sp. 21LCFQ010]|uniref:S-type pyocin domain-containing protein n=1 Tax=Pseudomonas sp. 21LCFQ010 TaxID=2957506 RepID=UPI0020977E44|nr:S-type pyocin domain-containing protein [Pseudomonas sp. 21LCFQ010]MCO8163734.1 S-type pyocin domain-containing protein [Pseudomonas sp. 21LCFQ010]
MSDENNDPPEKHLWVIKPLDPSKGEGTGHSNNGSGSDQSAEPIVSSTVPGYADQALWADQHIGKLFATGASSTSGNNDEALAGKPVPGRGSGREGWSVRIDNHGNFSGGFSGGFGGSSRKKAKRRAKAKAQAIASARAEAEARARAEQDAHQQAQRQQALAAHRSVLDQLHSVHERRRAELDDQYAQRKAGLAEQLDQEIRAAAKAPQTPGNERWQLYLISKKKAEIDAVATAKQAALQARAALASAFDGHDALHRTGQDYRQQLEQRSGESAQAAHDLHRNWEQAYIAAHENALLGESIRLLRQRIEALSEQYARDAIMWREQEQREAALRQKERQREEHVKHHQRVEEVIRQTRLQAANIRYIPVDMAGSGAILFGRSDTALAHDAAKALQAQVRAAVTELVRVALIRAGQTVALGVTTALYSPVLGNGELTPEQRRRFSQGMGVNAEVMGVPSNIDLPAIAEAGGTIDLPTRIKLVPVDQGTELHVVSTGPGFTAQVPVIMAAPHPLTTIDEATVSAPPGRQVVMDSAPATSVTLPVEHHVFGTELQVAELPAGVDLRFDDCIVCFAPELGLAPLYLSFPLPSAGYGVVTGQGVPGDKGWRLLADSPTGAALPEQVGERLRQREFHSLSAFDASVWRVLAEDDLLNEGFDPLSVKRMLRGMPPYAPKANWVGERRHYEIRAKDTLAAQANPFDLSSLVMTKPDSDYGVARFTQAYQSWPTARGNLVWTPLHAPGTELLGATTTPAEPQQPTVHSGSDIEPLSSQVDPLPVVDPADLTTVIPGYAEEEDLPSSDLIFAEPVKVLETGPYDKLERRSRGDGLDVDHILSRAAFIRLVRTRYPGLLPEEVKKMSNSAPSIVIPKAVHEKYSETFRWKKYCRKTVKRCKRSRGGC